MLANLTGALLERSAQALAGLVAPDGHLIVSGILESEGTVLPAIGRFATQEVVEREDEWMAGIYRSFQTY